VSYYRYNQNKIRRFNFLLLLLFSEFIYFKNIYEYNVIKFVLLGYFCLTCIFTTPFYFLIIVFEKNCHYRKLINQMLSSVMYVVLTHNTIFMPMTMFVYLVSPIDSPTFCKIYIIIYNMCAYHFIMLLDGMLVAKVKIPYDIDKLNPAKSFEY
jgi:hypothetical protein